MAAPSYQAVLEAKRRTRLKPRWRLEREAEWLRFWEHGYDRARKHVRVLASFHPTALRTIEKATRARRWWRDGRARARRRARQKMTSPLPGDVELLERAMRAW